MMSKDEILGLLGDDSVSKDDKIAALMFAIFNIDDWRWLQALCMRFSSSVDDDIAGLAVTGLGHIARLYGKLDLGTIIPFLEEIKNSKTPLSGRAEDALEDIQIFIGAK